MTAVLLAVLLVLLALGVPVAFAVGLGGMAALLTDRTMPLEVAAQRAFAALDSWALMAVPLFILAGELMSVSGMAQRMLRLVSRAPAALPVVSIASSMGFAAVSGSSSASTAAVGSVMIPAMRRRGYPAGFAAAFQAAGGALGPIIPPSIIMIVVGHLTGASIAALFFGGIVPGLLVGGALMAAGYRRARVWERERATGSRDAASPDTPICEAVHIESHISREKRNARIFDGTGYSGYNKIVEYKPVRTSYDGYEYKCISNFLSYSERNS